MNVKKARQISKHVAKIAEITSTFQAKYGANYRLAEDSPIEAWDLYRRFMTELATIASLLDTDALVNPFVRYERWWERRDMMNTALVNEMASDTMRLVERAAYLVASEERDTKSLSSIQEGIAGLLHPSTRQKALHRPQ